MPVSKEGRKGLKSDGEVGSVPSDANPSGPTTNPVRLEQLHRFAKAAQKKALDQQQAENQQQQKPKQ